DFVNNSLLEFGAIMEDTNNIKSYEDLPKFQCYFYEKNYNVTPFAAALNHKIFETIDSLKVDCDIFKTFEKGESFSGKLLYPFDFTIYLRKWLIESCGMKPTKYNNKEQLLITVAGKNF